MFNIEMIDVGNFCLPIVHVTSFMSSEYLQCTKTQIKCILKKKKKKKKKNHTSPYTYFSGERKPINFIFQ